MITEVQGRVLLFSGMSLGPALSPQMRDFLKSVKPEEYYPGEHFLEIVKTAKTTNPTLLVAAGKSWGQIMKPMFQEKGIDSPMGALKAAMLAAQEMSFRGVSGSRFEPSGPASVTISENSGLPPELYSAIWEGHVIAWGGTDVCVDVKQVEGDFTSYHVSWKE